MMDPKKCPKYFPCPVWTQRGQCARCPCAAHPDFEQTMQDAALGRNVRERNWKLVEALAEYAHASWAGWTKWMFEMWDKPHASDGTFQARWKRQIAQTYDDLPESDKESDRQEAVKILEAVEGVTR